MACTAGRSEAPPPRAERGPAQGAAGARAARSTAKFVDDQLSLGLTDWPEVATGHAVRLDVQVVIEQPEQGGAAEPVLRLLAPAPGTGRHKAQQLLDGL